MRKNLLLTVLTTVIATQNCLASNIQFSELYPNPKGRDQGKEWIELFNTANTSINLKNWQIIQSKKTKKIKTDTIVPAQSYYSLPIALRNEENQLKLIDPDGQQHDQVNYSEVREGFSLSKIEKQWRWTNPTKNQPNPKLKKIKGKTTLDTQNQLSINNQKIAAHNINPLLLLAVIKNEKNATATLIQSNQDMEILELKLENPEPQDTKKPPLTPVINLLLILVISISIIRSF